MARVADSVRDQFRSWRDRRQGDGPAGRRPHVEIVAPGLDTVDIGLTRPVADGRRAAHDRLRCHVLVAGPLEVDRREAYGWLRVCPLHVIRATVETERC